MVHPEKYWILYGVNSFGHSQSREIPEAKIFFREYFTPETQREKIEHQKIQARLFHWYQDEETQEQVKAEFCLRCFVSNCIYRFCLTTEQQYQEVYGLSRNDLFPVLLDSITQINLTVSQAKNSLIKEIIDTFELDKKSSLSTWTKIKVKGNKNYKKVLKFYGIVEITDWLILVKTTPGNLERKLRQRGYSDYEIREYEQLLDAFHQVYTKELLEIREKINEERHNKGKRGTNKPYPNPTKKQLKQIAKILNNPKKLESQEVLEKLKKIAQFIRNHTLSNTALFTTETKPEPERELIIFIQEQIEDNLFTVVNQVISNRLNYFLNKKKPQTEKANNLILVLRLFHCEQYSMGEIASMINFTDQSKVSRLLKLKELREDVTRNAIAFLKERFKKQLTPLVSNPEQLLVLDTKIQEFLEVEIQEIMNEAKKEALNSQHRTRNSLFARTVCECVKQKGNNNNES